MQHLTLFHNLRITPLHSTLLFIGYALLHPIQSWATCTKISYPPTTTYSPSSIFYVDPTLGTTAVWYGSTDTGGSSGGAWATVNINSINFQPNGTLLASTVLPMLNLGNIPYSSPDQVLFRCDATDNGKLYEYYATNGDSNFGGRYDDGTALGVPQTFRTRYKGMGVRVTNVSTGLYFTRYYQRRPLTNLTTDKQGKILVKVKDFTNVLIQLYRLNNDSFASGVTSSGLYDYTQPAAYIAFQGGGQSSKLAVGQDANNYWDGYYGSWPGSVNLHHRVIIRRSATCAVTNVTPVVIFPTISVRELNQGGQRQLPFTIRFQCQTGPPANTGLTAMASGTAAGQTSMGILVNTANYQSAFDAGLTTAGSGVTYLLSDGYGIDPSVATGVGVAISHSNGAALNLLSNDQITLGGNNDGWFPVLTNADTASNCNGITSYATTLNATMKKIPNKTVTAGTLKATAQIVIRVQ